MNFRTFSFLLSLLFYPNFSAFAVRFWNHVFQIGSHTYCSVIKQFSKMKSLFFDKHPTAATIKCYRGYVWTPDAIMKCIGSWNRVHNKIEPLALVEIAFIVQYFYKLINHFITIRLSISKGLILLLLHLTADMMIDYFLYPKLLFIKHDSEIEQYY